MTLTYITRIRVLLDILADESLIFMEKHFPTFQELCLGRCEQTLTHPREDTDDRVKHNSNQVQNSEPTRVLGLPTKHGEGYL